MKQQQLRGETNGKTEAERPFGQDGFGRIRYISEKEKEYPDRLRNIINQPKGLYVLGKMPEKEEKTVAIVGARECSCYGESAARYFARELAAYGVGIISGMARGIDAAAHEGALESGGKTYAVLGCGVDICYPKSNRLLYEKIQKQGGILSEYAQGTEPLPFHFPLRNRIISALADAVLIVEARKKSGSLITADLALEQGKDVYAVPGGIFEPLSAGCNRLIAQGAAIAFCPEDIIRDLGILTKKNKKKEQKNNFPLATKEKLVYSHLCLLPKSAETLGKEVELPVEELLAILLELEMSGYAREVAKNHFIKEK